ncbi:MAG: hypothetical protein JNL40_01745 [Cyclobacteriaceae bacterium]|nr:hypothetical protein [Cyclobacteriaceae bacterium]
MRCYSVYILATLLALIQLGCRPKELSFKELAAYAADPENGLRKSETAGGILVEVQYRPTDLWVHQELGETMDTASIRKLRNKYSQYDYYILSLSRDGREALTPGGNMGLYSELVQILSFRMGEYITMTTDRGDTIAVSDANLSRTYGMGHSTDILLVFSRKETEDRDWVQLNLNEFGLATGNQRFRFRVKDLRKVPNINFITSD